MDNQESITPAPAIKPEEKNNNKQMENSYELSLNDDIYLLIMKIIPDNKIHFKIRQINNLSFFYYEREYKYEEITKIFFLENNYYDSINKIFKFYDIAITRKKVNLSLNKEKNTIVLSLKKPMDFDEVECCLNLEEKKLTNEEMLKILFNEIKEMKLNNNKTNNDNDNNNNQNLNNNKDKNENNEKIQYLINKNEELEKKMNSIIDENIKLKNSISELQNTINELILKKDSKENEIQIKEESNSTPLNIDINFYGNPEKLDFKDCLTSNHSKSGWLRQFVVYTGIKDNIDYLIYNDKNNFNINIIRINDKKNVHYFKGHKDQVSVMRYFIQNNNNEYLLSCDESRIVFCWDIQKYTQYFKIHTNFSGYIWDALILFNIFGNNYLLLPSNSLTEYTKIYDFKENSSFIKDIFGTYDNKTNYLIPWYYNNNYYLIECCSSKISINNILKDENYAVLKQEPEGLHCCGYIFNNNYLCVTDYNNNFIRIWDLINKSIFKEICFEANLAYGIIPWNNTYSIVACSGCLVVIDLKQEKMTYKIISKKIKASFCDVIKIQLSKYGECLVCSDTNNNIRLFNLKRI